MSFVCVRVLVYAVRVDIYLPKEVTKEIHREYEEGYSGSMYNSRSSISVLLHRTMDASVLTTPNAQAASPDSCTHHSSMFAATAAILGVSTHPTAVLLCTGVHKQLILDTRILKN